MTLVLGAVAYDTKVVTIWTGFRGWFLQHGLDFDYVLYSNYERQVDDLVAGRIGVAWNSPLAWVKARRKAAASGCQVEAMAMRDSDRDLTSVVVVRAESPLQSLQDLRGKTVGVGAMDSPQARLLPLALMVSAGLEPGTDFRVRRFDVGVGLHGDHIGGERDAARSLILGEVDAACMIATNHERFIQDGTLPSGATRVIGHTAPFDHCNLTVGPGAEPADVARFRDLLLGMSYADADLRPLLDLEGLKAWCPGRTEGYAPLEQAVDELGFYDAAGRVSAGSEYPL